MFQISGSPTVKCVVVNNLNYLFFSRIMASRPKKAKSEGDKSRRDSDSSSIEMLEEFRRKSIEDEDHDEASSSSVTTTKVMKRGRGRPKSSTRKQGMMMDVCIVLCFHEFFSP